MSDQIMPKVQTGMRVKIKGSQSGHDDFVEVFHFVPNAQVDLTHNKISIDSPLGKVLFGAKEGDKALLETKQGKIDLEVLELARL